MTSLRSTPVTWDKLQISGIQRIERVVAEFYVECSDIPNRYCRVKITEDANGTYIGRMNLSLKKIEDETPEWIAGLGSTIDAALEDTLQQFTHQLKHDQSDDRPHQRN